MVKIARVGLVLAAALIIPTGAFAATGKSHSAKAKAHKSAQNIVLVCPVTGEKIASIKDAAGHSTYKGKTYYFCCSSCKPEFDKNPEKYIKSASAK